MLDSAPFVSTQSHRRLLYVGCDHQVLKLLQAHLKTKGWFFVRSPGGHPACLLLESEIHYDLLIFDDELPVSPGRQWLELAHSLTHRARTPVILLHLSGDCTLETWLERGEAERCLQSQKHLYVLRPQSQPPSRDVPQKNEL